MARRNNRRLVEVAGDGVSTLFIEGSRLETLRHALATIADAVDADRISLVEFETAADDSLTTAHHRFDWRREDSAELFNDPETASIIIDDSHAFWSRPRLGEGSKVTQTTQATRAVQERLTSWNVQTVVSVPVALGKRFSGAVNLVHKRHTYHWSPEELVVLQAVAGTLAAACLRYDTDARLAASQDLSREAFDNATVGMVVLAADGTMLEVNDAFCALLGYEHDQLRGRNTLMLAHPDDVSTVLASRSDMRSLKITDAERRFVCADGSVVWTRCNLSPLRTHVEGGPSGLPAFVAQIRDITAIRQAGVIAELERSNRELEQFAYIASHDLQEPLRMVTSYLELLQRRYAGQLDSDADEFIEFAVDGARRMRALISGLLVYSRLDSQGGPHSQIDLAATLDEALQPLRLLMHENDARVTHDELPVVSGDAVQLTQLFQNLIENAIKFRRDEPPEVHVSAAREEDVWAVTVRDNGIGFDPEQAERIFGVFRRLHKYGQYPGTGIGLAICKRIVERHGGAISATSIAGQGSTFRFTLPAISG